MDDSTVCFTMLSNIISQSNTLPGYLIYFSSSTFTNHNVKQGRVKGEGKQLRNFKHKVNDKIG